MMDEPRTLEQVLGEDIANFSLRPQVLEDFTGQKELCKNLSIFIASARMRRSVLDHVLFFGPAGLGKTTLAQVTAKELGVGFRVTSGPVIKKTGDLAAILTSLQEKDVLFIDEIHRLSLPIEELLYTAMEDFQLDVMIGEGPSARMLRIALKPFTLIGATTRQGLLSGPFRDRFGIPLQLHYYDCDDLVKIIVRASMLLQICISMEGAQEIARRSRGTPRIAGRLLRRVQDFSVAKKCSSIGLELVDYALTAMHVDAHGLNEQDRKYMSYLEDFYNGGPVGIETVAAALSEDRGTLEEVVEPYLMQKGLLHRTPRGRVLTKSGRLYLEKFLKR